ncbi:MAG: Mrp/NBP35 family ATP-binding protein [Bacteriovoracaceae bacterium]
MSDKYLTLLAGIKNPETSVSLGEENRLLNVEEKNGDLYIKYRRDGISPAQKKEIETQFLTTLEPYFSAEKITITTVSENSQDVYKNMVEPANKSAPQAELKVGHATVGAKKPVPNVKKVIAVASGKGGVGKSTFTVNLALTLKNKGFKVGIIDADIYGPSIPMLLGRRDAKPKVNEARKIIPVESFGIGFISFGLFIEENDPVIWRGPMLGGVLSQFLFDVDWGGLDYLILDLPPGTGDIQLSMVQNTVVDGAIIISTPQDVALLDAKKGLQMFNKVNVPIIGMVENMSHFTCDGCGKDHHIFGQGGVENAVKELNTTFLGAIPLELDLRTGSDKGEPYMANLNYESRPVWKAYNEIATKVHDSFNPEKKTTLFSRIFK